MGNPCLYVKPVAADGTTGSVIKVEWPSTKSLQVCEAIHLRTRNEARAALGAPHFVQYGASLQLTLRVSGLASGDHQDFINRLDAVDSALSMGAICHFTLDRDKAGVWPLNNALGLAWAVPTQGDTTIYYTNTEELLGIETSPAVAAGDDIFVETDQPEGHRSRHRVSTRSTSQITLPTSNGIAFTSSANKAIYHYAGFFPSLRLHPDSLTQPRLRRETSVTWAWEAVFQSVPVDLFDLITGVGP